MGNGIKAIVFDLGNVLVDFDHTTAAKRMTHFSDRSLKEIFDLFFDSEATGLFEAGRISPQDFFLKVKEALGLRIDYSTFVPIWNDIFFFSAKNRAVYSLANTLRQDYRIAIISNINTLHYAYVKERFPVFSIFHHVFASCELGAIKPRHEAYNQMLAGLKIPAENIFYTDDRPELVESARTLGINSFVFSGVGQLRDDLAGAGVQLG